MNYQIALSQCSSDHSDKNILIYLKCSCNPYDFNNVLFKFFPLTCLILGVFFLRFYFFIFRDRGREGGKGEKHQCVVASHMPPTGNLACNPVMCPHQTSDPLVRRPLLNPLSHTSQGWLVLILNSSVENVKTSVNFT